MQNCNVEGLELEYQHRLVYIYSVEETALNIAQRLHFFFFFKHRNCKQHSAQHDGTIIKLYRSSRSTRLKNEVNVYFDESKEYVNFVILLHAMWAHSSEKSSRET